MSRIVDKYDFTLQDVLDVLPITTGSTLETAISDSNYDAEGSRWHPVYEKTYDEDRGYTYYRDRLSNWRAYGNTIIFENENIDQTETESGYPVIFMDVTDEEGGTNLITVEYNKKIGDDEYYLGLYGVSSSGDLLPSLDSEQQITAVVHGLIAINEEAIIVLAKDDTNVIIVSFDITTYENEFEFNDQVLIPYTDNDANPIMKYHDGFLYVTNVDNTDATNSFYIYEVNLLVGTLTQVFNNTDIAKVVQDVYIRPGITSGAAISSDDYSTAVTNISIWFLPSKDELNVMYINLKLEDLGGFSDDFYWSSSEYSSTNGWRQSFNDGVQGSSTKSGSRRVRACRTFEGGGQEVGDIGPGGGYVFAINGQTKYEASESDVSDGYYWSDITDSSVGTTGTTIGTGITNTATIIAQTDHIASAAYAAEIAQDEFDFLEHIFVATQQNITLYYPSDNSITVDWGDGNTETQSGNGGVGVVFTSTYSTPGTYDITISGDILYMTQIRLFNEDFSGDISTWSVFVPIVSIVVTNNPSLAGDVSSWKALANIAQIAVNNTSITGDLSGWSVLTNLVSIAFESSSVSGDISSWSTLTSLVQISGFLTSVSGDISSWATMTSLTSLNLIFTSIDFDTTTAWVGHDHSMSIRNCSMTSTQVDNAIIAFAGGSFVNKTITVITGNSARTAASDTAYNTLIAAGNTVT
jgi:hypothetical protein